MLTVSERVYGLSLIWKEAEYNFAFWDKHNVQNWGKEYIKALDKVIETQTLYDYYLELSRFVAFLKDGHSLVVPPQEILPDFLMRSALPIELAFIEERHIVVNYKECFRGKIDRFSQVQKINGIDVDIFIEEYVLPYCWHEKYDSSYRIIQNWMALLATKSKMTWELLSPSGKTKIIDLHVTNEKEPDMVQWCIKPDLKHVTECEEVYRSDSHYILMTADNIAILGISSFRGEKLQQEYYNNLHILKEAKGIMVDIRENSGGNSGNADAVAQSFIDGSFVNSTYKHQIHNGAYMPWARRQKFGELSYEEIARERGGNEWLEKAYKVYKHQLFETGSSTSHLLECPVVLKQPVVVLAGCDTASAAEDFLVELDYVKRITIVGAASFGSTGNPLIFDLPGGGSCYICARQCTYPDGRDFINKGVQPHFYAKRSIADWENGYDSVFDQGIKVLRTLI